MDSVLLPASTSLILGLIAAAVLYGVYRAAAPFIAIRRHLKEARTVGLPVQILPVPQGLFSFFAFQVATKLRLVRPGSWLHRILNAGRPDGHSAHKDLGDCFLTVNPFGVGLVVADASVASYVSSRREQFPKPPNTGAIINIYGRNVINARGDTWRFHRRVTGPVFSERIHARVWDEAARQVAFMRSSWGKSGHAADVGRDALRLGLNVITGVAYGSQLGWQDSPPNAIPANQEGGGVEFAHAVENLNANLMSIFLTPKWWLRLAPASSAAGRARAAYAAFGGFMRGMLDAERRRMADGASEESLLTVILDAAAHEDKEGRRMTEEEVMGNAFIFLFAGHETTANTLHYGLLQLAAHPNVQEEVIAEIDALRAAAKAEGRELGYEDFTRARWLMAVMNETLRMYTPTSMVHKWTDAPAPMNIDGKTYVIPAKTRISINCTGVHANPAVWGEDADTWNPERWIVPAGANGPSPLPSPMFSPPAIYTSFSRMPSIIVDRAPRSASAELISPPLTPPSPTSVLDSEIAESRRSSVSSTTTAVHSQPNTPFDKHTFSSSDTPKSPLFGLYPPSPSQMKHEVASYASTPAGPWNMIDVLKPAKGAFLPFSEGSRMCSGRKFAQVEFVSSLCALLHDQRVTLGEGWTPERLVKSLRGRKAGALTLQPPEVVPLVFSSR